MDIYKYSAFLKALPFQGIKVVFNCMIFSIVMKKKTLISFDEYDQYPLHFDFDQFTFLKQFDRKGVKNE